MSQYCGFNRFMAENIRHAIMHNMYGNEHGRFEHTYKEYPLYPHRGEGHKFIDVVGKHKHNDSIKDSVVVEVKSDWADFNTGHGLNLYGSWNFIAVKEGLFAQELLYKMCLERVIWDPVGLLQVTDNGSVETLLPAKGIWHPFTSGLLHIENHWEDLEAQADSQGSVENAFQSICIPIYKKDDAYRKINKIDVEIMTVNSDEYFHLSHNTPVAFRESILDIENISYVA